MTSPAPAAPSPQTGVANVHKPGMVQVTASKKKPPKAKKGGRR